MISRGVGQEVGVGAREDGAVIANYLGNGSNVNRVGRASERPIYSKHEDKGVGTHSNRALASWIASVSSGRADARGRARRSPCKARRRRAYAGWERGSASTVVPMVGMPPMGMPLMGMPKPP